MATSQQVYSAANLQNATTSPTARPDDLLGIRNQINADLGIPQLQSDYNTAYKTYLDTQTSQDNALNQLEGKTMGMNVIRGAQAETNRQFAQNLGAQARGLEAMGANLQAKLSEANTQFTIRSQQVQEQRNLMLQFPEAGIKWGDTTEKAAKKISKYNEKQISKQYKSKLKEALLALGKNTEGSTKELEKKLKKLNREEYERTKRASDMEMQKAQMELDKMRKSLNAESITMDDIASWFGGETTQESTIQTPNGGMSIDPNNVQSYWSKLGINN